MRLIYAMLLGFILDLIFGDPHGLIHPVQIIGWFIDKLKKGMQHMIYGCSYEEVREKEIERVIQILSRRTKNNPCLIGEPGFSFYRLFYFEIFVPLPRTTPHSVA